MNTWVPIPEGCEFGPATLPYGVFAPYGDDEFRVGVAIGDHVIDIAPFIVDDDLFKPQDSLNQFMEAGPEMWAEARAAVIDLITDPRHRNAVESCMYRRDRVRMAMPFEPADYVDFYASKHHASNLGRILRPGTEPLQPNWTHLPVGYHGRAGTLVVSGTPIIRPKGQRPGDPVPTFGPSHRLDIEAEVGFVVGVPSTLGEPVPIDDFAKHVFGVVLVNDWSARDIQAWEYRPLGPHLGKSFATSISAWVVPLEALEAARVPGPVQDPAPMPYLTGTEDWGLDLRLEVELNGQVISKPPFDTMYWTAAQQFAHMTVNGASVRTGDLFASGTVSGTEPDQWGSLIEMTRNGTEPIKLADGSTRQFLNDSDTVTIRATAPGPDGETVALGPVTGTIKYAR